MTTSATRPETSSSWPTPVRRGQGPDGPLRQPRGDRARRQRRQLRDGAPARCCASSANPAPASRVTHARADAPAAASARRHRAAACASPATTCWRCRSERELSTVRGSTGVDDLPGADDGARSRSTPSASRSPRRCAATTGCSRKAGMRARARTAANWCGPLARAPAEGLSARTVRRPAPARDDRHGAVVPPEPAAGRRADHRARRHRADPGADAAAQAAAGARHGR